jgi:hypothetical protein
MRVEVIVRLTKPRHDAERAPSALDRLQRLYAGRGEAATHGFCAEKGLIASICMCCDAVYRIAPSQGGTGGLSHGWCSKECTDRGADRAALGRRSVLPNPAGARRAHRT